MSPEQLADVLDCGNPEQTWEVMIAHFRLRAAQSLMIASELRGDAEDAAQRAAEHASAAEDFTALAATLEQASITFAASVDTLPKGQDAKQGLAGTEGSAVPKADAQPSQPLSPTKDNSNG